MGYSRYGKSGKGLSDRAQRKYNRRRTFKRMREAPTGKGIFQDLAYIRMAEESYAEHFTKGGKLKGVYQVSPSGIRTFVPSKLSTKAAQTKSQFGSHTTGYAGASRRMPLWVMQMLGKGTALGKPPGQSKSEDIGTLLGLATSGYLIFKVLV